MPAPTAGGMQRGGYRHRMMVPRYSAEQTGNPPPKETPPAQSLPPHPAAEPMISDTPPLPPVSPVPPPKPPHAQSENPPERKLTELLTSATDLPARIARMDGETLLLLGILWMLWQEKADRRLLLALAYILL